MTKKISKLLLTFLLIIVTVSSFSMCFAETNGETTKAATTSETEQTSEDTEEIYNGDLYLFDNNIVMDKLVDGNVFVFGNNVEVTGQVNGNLFVFANKLTFNNCYVRYSIFACANSVNYNGACNDLYVASSTLEMTYDSYVVRDVKAVSSDVIFKAAVGRDVDLSCGKVDFGEGENIPVIYGSLRYSAPSEATIPEGVISGEGSVTYNKEMESNKNVADTVSDILIGFLTCIATALVIYAITKKFTPNFNEKLTDNKLSALKLLKSFGLGIAALFIVLVLFVLLLMTAIGAKLGFVLVLLFAIICLISVPVLSIIITNALKPTFKIEKTPMFCLILALVSVVLYGVTLIPFVGGLLGLIIKLTAIGLLIDMHIPHKELTEEEKAAIEEAKKQAKEEKAKRKQEKLEAKEAKKNENKD